MENKVVRKSELENKYSRLNRKKKRVIRRNIRIISKSALLLIACIAIVCIIIGINSKNSNVVAAVSNDIVVEEEVDIYTLLEEEKISTSEPPIEIFSDPEEDGWYWEKKFQEDLEKEVSEPKDPLPIVITSTGSSLIVENTLPEELEEEVNWTEEDKEYLVMVLTGECQNRSYDVQLLYGSVVLNRVNSKRFPNTIKEVCTAKKQYECFNNGMAYRTPTQDSIDAAQYLLENGSVIPENVVFQARFKQGDGIWKEVQGEYFCYLNNY